MPCFCDEGLLRSGLEGARGSAEPDAAKAAGASAAAGVEACVMGLQMISRLVKLVKLEKQEDRMLTASALSWLSSARSKQLLDDCSPWICRRARLFCKTTSQNAKHRTGVSHETKQGGKIKSGKASVRARNPPHQVRYFGQLMWSEVCTVSEIEGCKRSWQLGQQPGWGCQRHAADGGWQVGSSTVEHRGDKTLERGRHCP